MLFTYYDRNPGLKKEVFTKSFVESLELARRNSLMVQFINDYSSDAPATNAEWETDARVQLKPQEKVDILKVRVVRHRLAEAV
jgi:predicted transcriptional regulator